MTDKWNRLVSSSLVGTRNRPYMGGSGNTTLDDLLAQLDTADEEQALLAEAAALVIYRNVGRVRVDDYTRKLPAPAAKETFPVCSPQATDYLQLILDEKVAPELLTDWMNGAAARDVRVPEKLLLPLMEQLAAQSNISIHPATLQIIGERGRWLAQQRKRWKFVNWQHDFEKLWRSASDPLQDMLFRLLRSAQPHHAREFLIAQRSTVGEHRLSKFVDWMGHGTVFPEDEPFLEALLDEDNPDLNQSAADVLRCLPSSAYVQRMINRLRNRVWLETAADGTLHLRWQQIDTLDAAMQRDTMDRSGYSSYRQPQSRLLEFAMRCVPPATWTDWLGHPPRELVALGAQASSVFVRSWARAVNAYGGAAWAQALAEHCLATEADRSHLPLVTAQLPEDARERITVELWRESPIKSFVDYASYTEKSWPLSLSQRAIEIYHDTLHDADFKDIPALANALHVQQFCIHPHAVESLTPVIRRYVSVAMSQDDRQQIEHSLRTMETRAGIWKVFQ
ncbi:MAG: DUF5691 domain-containing protein [Chloroflexota bacterium]